MRSTIQVALVCMWAVWACGCGPANNAAPAPQQVHAPANAAMPAAVVKTAEPGLTVEVLGNGLTVIVRENHSSPVVVVQSFVRAGSMYEGKYLGCGISHLVEHLVAEGAESGAAASGAAKARASRIDKIGGQSNAFTGMENTAYYIAAAAGRADECIDLVADWMARPSITQADFDREHGVVTRELEMGLDDPDRQLWYAHQANMYGTHPAGIPTIGYKAPLAALTLQDVLDYHGRMYVPQNMVFVVVGDVDTAKVLARIQKSFAATAPGRRFDYVLPEVEPVAAPRRVEVSSKLVKETLEVMAFQTIPLVHEDLYALDVLSYILSNGDASRLARTVKRQARLVTNISSSSWTPAWGKGSFEIEFHCAPDKPDQAEKAILAELATVAGAKVSDEELSRAKRQKVSDQVYTQQTVESQAGTLGGDLLSTNDVNFSKHYTDRIQQVTAEQVQAVAKKYLDPARVVITRLAPEATSAATTTAPTSRPSTRPEATLFKLPNGLRVVLYPTPTVDLVSMVLTTRGGLLLETDKTNGMGSLMTALSTCGAGTLSAEDIASFFDDAGGAVTAICGNNTFLYTATVLSDSADKAVPVFADVVLHPTFPEAELKIVQPKMLANVARAEGDWHGLLTKRFRHDFFPGSPLALLPSGSEAVLNAATAKSVADYHKDTIKAGDSVLAIYGRFDKDRMEQQVRKLFAAMPEGVNKLPVVAPRQVAPGGEVFDEKGRTAGAGVIVAAPGMKLTDKPDSLAMTVLKTIISGYQLPSGWLHNELRGQKLVYVVHALNWEALVPGAFYSYAQCEPANVEKVAQIIRDNFRKTTTYAFTQEEVDDAVNTVLTADLLGKQEMLDLATQAALNELYGFGYDYSAKLEKLLRAVTPADVSAVAKKYLSGGYVTVIVTPEGEPAGSVEPPAPEQE